MITKLNMMALLFLALLLVSVNSIKIDPLASSSNNFKPLEYHVSVDQCTGLLNLMQPNVMVADVTQDIYWNESFACFWLSTNNTVLDCHGHKLVYMGSMLDLPAVSIYGYQKPAFNMEVRNCVIENSTLGVVVQNSVNAVVKNNTIRNSLRGFVIGKTGHTNDYTNNVLLVDNRFENNQYFGQTGLFLYVYNTSVVKMKSNTACLNVSGGGNGYWLDIECGRAGGRQSIIPYQIKDLGGNRWSESLLSNCNLQNYGCPTSSK